MLGSAAAQATPAKADFDSDCAKLTESYLGSSNGPLRSPMLLMRIEQGMGELVECHTFEGWCQFPPRQINRAGTNPLPNTTTPTTLYHWTASLRNLKST